MLIAPAEELSSRAAEESIVNPPAEAERERASAPVPADARTRDASKAPAREIVRSSAAPSAVNVTFDDAPIPSSEKFVPASMKSWSAEFNAMSLDPPEMVVPEAPAVEPIVRVFACAPVAMVTVLAVLLLLILIVPSAVRITSSSASIATSSPSSAALGAASPADKTTLSFPAFAASVAASMTEPAVAVIERASTPVPDEVRKRLEFVAPVTAIVKSSASVPEASVKFMSSAPSMETTPVESIVIPFVPESTSIPPAASSATIRTASVAASLAIKLILPAAVVSRVISAAEPIEMAPVFAWFPIVTVPVEVPVLMFVLLLELTFKLIVPPETVVAPVIPVVPAMESVSSESPIPIVSASAVVPIVIASQAAELQTETEVETVLPNVRAPAVKEATPFPAGRRSPDPLSSADCAPFEAKSSCPSPLV